MVGAFPNWIELITNSDVMQSARAVATVIGHRKLCRFYTFLNTKYTLPKTKYTKYQIHLIEYQINLTKNQIVGVKCQLQTPKY